MRQMGMGAVESNVEEGRILEKKLFLPLVNLWRTRPEMEKVLEGQ
jgi:hypothetical protein